VHSNFKRKELICPEGIYAETNPSKNFASKHISLSLKFSIFSLAIFSSRKKIFLDFGRMNNKALNFRCALIFNSQKCDLKVAFKFEIIKHYTQEDIKYNFTDIQTRQRVAESDYSNTDNFLKTFTELIRDIVGILFKICCLFIP
jgi:hypothetical protein